MELNESSSSLQVHQTIDGSETSSPKSGKLSQKYRGGRYKMSMKEQREAARLYKEKAGTAAEIGRMYGVHYSTIYDILDRFNVERHVPAASVSHSASMKKYWAERKSEEIKAGAGRAVYSPDLRDQYLVTEAPAPVQKQQDGVDIDAIHVKPRRKTTRKKKSWWQRVKDKLFKR